MVPNNQQIIEAISRKNIAFACRSCGNDSQLKMDVAGVNLSTLGMAGVNQQTSSVRHIPMALLLCGGCGETRFYALEWLGFRPPY